MNDKHDKHSKHGRPRRLFVDTKNLNPPGPTHTTSTNPSPWSSQQNVLASGVVRLTYEPTFGPDTSGPTSALSQQLLSALSLKPPPVSHTPTDPPKTTGSEFDPWFAGPYPAPVQPEPFPDITSPSGSASIHAAMFAATTPILWDVRQDPFSTMAFARTAPAFFTDNCLAYPVLTNHTRHVRIISKDFPWAFDIGPKSRAVACTDVLYHLYTILQKPLEDAIWGAADDSKRHAILKAWKRRGGSRPLNVDWLCKDVMFRGLMRNDSFAERRLHPMVPDVDDTLVIAFGRD